MTLVVVVPRRGMVNLLDVLWKSNAMGEDVSNSVDEWGFSMVVK